MANGEEEVVQGTEAGRKFVLNPPFNTWEEVVRALNERNLVIVSNAEWFAIQDKIEDTGAAIAKAILEEVVQGTEADSTAILERGISKLYEAVCNKGSHPHYHDVIMDRSRRDWPILWDAIDEIVAAWNEKLA